MSINWNRNQPIIHHMRQVLPSVFPVLSEPGHGLHRSGVGGYNNRQTRFGSFSAHSEGRAADIYLDANNVYEAAIGSGLFNMFISYAIELGVDNVIWDRRIWSVTNGGPRAYEHGAHRDHVHVEFTRDGSQLRPASLIQRTRTVLNRLPIAALQYRRSSVATGSVQ